MKITIDTTYKTISVESPVKLEELMSEIKQFFPKEEWKEYSLISNYSYPYYPTTYTVPYTVGGTLVATTGTTNAFASSTSQQ